MYLKGACKDETAAYPLLRCCRRDSAMSNDTEHGAGISVNRWFRYVNWVAVPGKPLFFDGLLAPGERVTRARFDASIRAELGTPPVVSAHLAHGGTPLPRLQELRCAGQRVIVGRAAGTRSPADRSMQNSSRRDPERSSVPNQLFS